MIDRAVTLLLEAGAREVLAREWYLFTASPADKAAAAGFLEYLRARDEMIFVHVFDDGPVKFVNLFEKSA